MGFPDAFRAQYYLGHLQRKIAETKEFIADFPFFSSSKDFILENFSKNLALELDRILLPSIAFEISEKKNQGFLRGSSSTMRYESFFVESGNYTDSAKNLVNKYGFLFQIIDLIIDKSFENLVQCLQRFQRDFVFLKTSLSGINPYINSVRLLTSSDRHCRKQSLLLDLDHQKKIIYKPVDLHPDILFQEFVRVLDLPEQLALKTCEVVPRSGYGWINFIQPNSCHDRSEVELFYRKAGVLLAIAEALHYTDGHFENFMADGVFPILLDGETLFQNYSEESLEQKNILATMLVQKAESVKGVFSSALQCSAEEKFEAFHTFAHNDHTDEIALRHFGMTPKKFHHLPMLDNIPQMAWGYKIQLTEGFIFGYDRVTEKANEILKNEFWWDRVSKVRVRTVLRETSAYYYLVRQIQMPENMTSKDKACSLLHEKLGNNPFSEYETEELLEMEIPYFYHFPGNKDLYNGKDQVYKGVFKNSAVDSMKRAFASRSEEKKEFNCEILRRHIVPISEKIKTTMHDHVHQI